MSLAFLVPLFLLGLAGIVVPILVHLTRRQRRNVVTFPSLMFLERIPFQEQRRRRIQHWLLLALRSLALALLALAFARPFLDRSDLSLGAASGPREIVVLLDQSYSMEIGDQFTRALDEAREIFTDLGPGKPSRFWARSSGGCPLDWGSPSAQRGIGHPQHQLVINQLRTCPQGRPNSAGRIRAACG